MTSLKPANVEGFKLVEACLKNKEDLTALRKIHLADVFSRLNLKQGDMLLVCDVARNSFGKAIAYPYISPSDPKYTTIGNRFDADRIPAMSLVMFLGLDVGYDQIENYRIVVLWNHKKWNVHLTNLYKIPETLQNLMEGNAAPPLGDVSL